MHSRRSFSAFTAFTAMLALAALATAIPAFADEPDHYEKLFFIQRSKNKNEVHYDARVLKDGSLDPREPLVGYWINKAEDGSRSGISFMQRIAYGYDTEATGKDGSYALKLKAFKDRPMWIAKINGRWKVQTTIAGKQAYMERLYVATDESGTIPSVIYVDVFGTDAASGAAVQEHIKK